MTDFLGNLIMRSTVDPSPSALLQPRLPSLFEPPADRKENLLPTPEPVVRETVAPISEPSVSASTINELPGIRPTLTAEPVERERTVNPMENRTPSAPDQKARPPVTETHQEVIQPVQPTTQAPDQIAQTVPFLSHLKEPQRTIIPGQEELPPTEAQRSFAPMEHEKLPPAERPSVRTISTRRSIDAPQITIGASRENSVFEDSVRSIVELVSLERGSKLRAVLQPVPTASRPARLEQIEQTRVPEPERVVEIHIGRIEVRATQSPTPLKRASQKAATMSLEDYLRSRPGEKP
jgi:hypothetical protein